MRSRYGDIEIGGWVKMSTRLGPLFMIRDLVRRNAMAIIFTAKNAPDVSLEVTEVKKLSGNLHRVRTRLANAKALPTMSYLAQKINLYPKDMLKVTGPGAKVAAGGTLVDPFIDKVAFKPYRPDIQFLVVPGFGKIEHEFLVEGKGPITISYESRHAGRLTKTVELD